MAKCITDTKLNALYIQSKTKVKELKKLQSPLLRHKLESNPTKMSSI